MGVQNLVRWGICEVESAIALATVAPRQAIGLTSILGSPVSQLLRWHLDESIDLLNFSRLIPTAE